MEMRCNGLWENLTVRGCMVERVEVEDLEQCIAGGGIFV
jgi:hypothetical protein